MNKNVITCTLAVATFGISAASASQANYLVPEFIAPSVVTESDVASPAVGQIIYDMSTQSFKGRPANANTWRELSPQSLVLAKATQQLLGLQPEPLSHTQITQTF